MGILHDEHSPQVVAQEPMDASTENHAGFASAWFTYEYSRSRWRFESVGWKSGPFSTSSVRSEFPTRVETLHPTRRIATQWKRQKDGTYVAVPHGNKLQMR